VAQRRHLDFYDIEPEIEVFTESPLGHQLLEVFISRCDDPDIDFDRRVRADSFQGPFRQHAQQFHLSGCIDLTNFIEKQSSAVRLLETADPPLRGPGERPPLVAE